MIVPDLAASIRVAMASVRPIVANRRAIVRAIVLAPAAWEPAATASVTARVANRSAIATKIVQGTAACPNVAMASAIVVVVKTRQAAIKIAVAVPLVGTESAKLANTIVAVATKTASSAREQVDTVKRAGRGSFQEATTGSLK